MNYNNYSISTSKGKLYLKSKTPAEGYEEVTYGTEGEKKTYHKYESTIQGMPTSLETKEVIFDGKTLKFLEFTLVDGEISNKISVPLKDQKGNYTGEVKALLSSLNNLKLNEPVTLSPKSTTSNGKNGKEYKNLNIYINYVNILGEKGKGEGTGYIAYTDIPAPTEKIVAGDKVWDWTPQTEFFYTKLQEIQERFKGVSTPPASQTASTPATEEKPKAMAPNGDFDAITKAIEEEDLELPF